MITGYNTDVRHGEFLFHVQTEDKPGSRPRIETRVYMAGEILNSRRSNYDDLAKLDPFPEDVVRARMDAQHHIVVLETSAGCFSEGDDPEDLSIRSATAFRPLGAQLLKALEETVVEPDAIAMTVLTPILGQDSSIATIEVRVTTVDTEEPVPGADLSFRMGSAADPKAIITWGKTDEAGVFKGTLPIPIGIGHTIPLFINCSVGLESEEAHILIDTSDNK